MLCCTTTLAVGVNLPAHTVILRLPLKYVRPPDFKQMAGRAGRTGQCTRGTVVVLCGNSKKKECREIVARGLDLLFCPIPGVQSAFLGDKDASWHRTNGSVVAALKDGVQVQG